jgi:hypothetical protein
LAIRYRKYSAGKNKSWNQADALVRKHLLLRWGKLRAADISRSDVKAMMVRIEAPIVSNQTLAAASAIFSWAIREEFAGIKVTTVSPATRPHRESGFCRTMKFHCFGSRWNPQFGGVHGIANDLIDRPTTRRSHSHENRANRRQLVDAAGRSRAFAGVARHQKCRQSPGLVA